VKTLPFRTPAPAAALATILIVFTGCGSAPAPRNPRNADVRTIKEGELLWVRNWSIRDVDRILAHYSSDAIWMGPHIPFANGREAIREIVQRLIEDGNLAIAFEPVRVDIAKSGEFGYSQGTYTMTLTDPVTKGAVTDRGSYLRLYRRELNGTWRAIQEINTSSPTDTPIIKQ
jgi:ketosteroid isomerase-like protein